MIVYKKPVLRSLWASEVCVSRRRDGRWVIDRYPNRTELPSSAFANWDQAQWTANQWANEELNQRQKEALQDEEANAQYYDSLAI